ncbi:MAG: hypothetical protein KC619_18600 [Myxococcales bacterium]|nr:hypothetical protein [Myxococcales bacterium]
MRSALALLLVLAGCGAGDVAPSEPAVSRLPDEVGPLDGLNRRHAQLRRRMHQRGYGEEVGLSRAFVLEDRGVAWPLDLAVGECATLLALGGGAIRDLSLTLYDGDGAVAATDTVEGEGGLVHVCPQAEPAVGYRPYYLELRAREGLGAVMVAHFRSSPGEGEGFDGLFEGVLAPRVPFREVEEHLARSRTALRARGFEPLGPPHLEHVAEGATVRQRVPLEAGRCYVVTGRSGAGLRDIDLFLFDAAGVEVARDLGADVEPSLEHCPDESARYLVELRIFEGAGAVGLMVLGGPGGEELVEQPAETDEPGPDTHHDPGPALGLLVAPLVERGFDAPVFVSRDAAIVPGEVRTHDVVVGPGCAVVAGTASDEAMDLDLYLADPDGHEVDRDTAVHSTARVRACREAATVMRVAVKAYGRDGAYALAVLRAPSEITDLRALRLEEVTAAYRLRGYESRRRWTASLEERERFRREIVVEPGRCVAVAAAGDEGARDVDLFLRDLEDELSASDSGNAPYATVSRCAESRQPLVIDLVIERGSGDIELLVLEAPAAESPPPPTEPPAVPTEE